MLCHVHFGLNAPPFEFTALPSALFLSAGHREAMAALEWSLGEPSGFALLIGEVGTGKTTLINALLARRYAATSIVCLSNPKLTFDQILQFILQQLKQIPAGTSRLDLLQALSGYLSDLQPSNRVVLIVDEAQDADDETLEDLRLLSNHEREGSKPLQIVLVGQPELLQRLKQPKLRQLDQRIGARAVLKSLTESEVYDYLDHCLRSKGGSSKLYSIRAKRLIVHHSQGIPRKINQICHNSLLFAFARGARSVGARDVREAETEQSGLLRLASQRSSAGVNSLSESASSWTRNIRRSAYLAAGIVALLGGAWETYRSDLFRNAIASLAGREGSEVPTQPSPGEASGYPTESSASAQPSGTEGLQSTKARQ